MKKIISQIRGVFTKNIKNKININRKDLSVIVIGVLALTGIFFNASQADYAKGPVQLKSMFSDEAAPMSSEELAKSESYQDLPVASVTEHKTENAWGTVVMLPQTHRNPGSQPGDRVNDTAEIAQKQIYQVVSHLVDKAKISFLMSEGDMYGTVPNEKINNVAEKINARNAFSKQVEELKNSLEKKGKDDSTVRNLLRDADQMIASLDREIILQGAPYKLKAEGKQFTMFGMENKDTYLESANAVRNYVYAQDRLSQLSKPAGGQQAGVMGGALGRGSMMPSPSAASPGAAGGQQAAGQPASPSAGLLGAMMGQSQGMNAIQSDLSTIKMEADRTGDTALGEQVSQCQKTLSSIDKIKQSEKELDMKNAPPAADRNSNPYASVTNQEEMKAKISEAEKKIQEVVVDKRNKETAENFAKALKEQKQTTGIIQIGSGHEEGLITELQKQGLNVVVVSTDQVMKDKTAAKQVKATAEQQKEQMEKMKQMVGSARGNAGAPTGAGAGMPMPLGRSGQAQGQPSAQGNPMMQGGQQPAAQGGNPMLQGQQGKTANPMQGQRQAAPMGMPGMMGLGR